MPETRPRDIYPDYMYSCGSGEEYVKKLVKAHNLRVVGFRPPAEGEMYVPTGELVNSSVHYQIDRWLEGSLWRGPYVYPRIIVEKR